MAQTCAQPVAADVLPGGAADRPDVTWLVHRVGQRLRAALDLAARRQGLAGGRDWLVLSALVTESGRSQLALAQELGLDKTTMTALLDRLERDGLVVRRVDPRDRRARIPEVTGAGAEAQARVAQGRDAAEAEVLGRLDADERAVLTRLLVRVARCTGDLPEPGGSCI